MLTMQLRAVDLYAVYKYERARILDECHRARRKQQEFDAAGFKAMPILARLEYHQRDLAALRITYKPLRDLMRPRMVTVEFKL